MSAAPDDPAPDRSHDPAAALTELRDAVAASRFDLEDDQAVAARVDRDALVQQLDDYVLPRLRRLDAPLLAVVGGSTGAGKSTLVNTLVGEHVTAPGVLRPTTRSPVLACNPTDRPWFADDRVLPDLARTTGGQGGPGTVELVVTDGLPPGLALLDAPDIDSVVTANRELATQLLAAADLWVFVTTAARYADAVPWDLLSAAQERGTAVTVVLDRIPPEAVAEVVADLERMLREHGLDARVHPVRESALVDGRVPDVEVAPLRDWLRSLAADAEARAEVIRATLEGALSSMERRVGALAAAAEAQVRTAAALDELVEVSYEEAAHEVEAAMAGGALLRGEVLARWQEFVGTGELMRSVQARVGALRDRVVGAFTGRQSPADGVQDAVETGVAALVHAAADGAAERTVDRWGRAAAGRALVSGRERELSRACSTMLDRLPDEVRDWQGAVLDLVREQGADRRTSARIASYTLNGAGLAVMLAVFASTGGLTGAEVVVAGGTSAASQKVIEAVFGDQAVRTLARSARDDLLARVDRLLTEDQQRFRALVDAARATEAPALGDALRRWRVARQTAALR